jgi:hypothetical protein
VVARMVFIIDILFQFEPAEVPAVLRLTRRAWISLLGRGLDKAQST